LEGEAKITPLQDIQIPNKINHNNIAETGLLKGIGKSDFLALPKF
jgi:hypothetical protein